MPSTLKSDVTISAEKFDPEAIQEHTLIANNQLLELYNSQVSWWEVGAPRYREMRDNGETTLPGPTVVPAGQNITIPSRDEFRAIPCRLFYPNDNKSESKGVIAHMHGGGWVLGSEASQDGKLKEYADASGCAVISIGYRLCPENPYPAPCEDCFDVAEYLVDKGEEEFGGPLRFVGGESAGAHLALLVTFHLLHSRPNFSFLGLLLHFGCYNLTIPRSDAPYPILSLIHYKSFCDAFTPNYSLIERQNPSISPYYEDLSQWRGKLPSVLFTCGTVDILLEDTVLMSAKWQMHGGEAIAKIYTGACHGYLAFSGEVYPQAKEGMDDTLAYIKEKMATVS